MDFKGDKVINLVLVMGSSEKEKKLKAKLENQAQFNILAQLKLSEINSFLRHKQVDIIIIDINELIQDTKLIEQVKYNYPEVKMVLQTDAAYLEVEKQAFLNGIVGSFYADISKDAFMSLLTTISNGYLHFSKELVHYFVNDYQVLKEKNEVYYKYVKPLHLLTNRECEILQLLSEGYSNKLIAEQLVISEKTVKNHVSNILKKIKVEDRTQAVVYAIKNGWVRFFN